MICSRYVRVLLLVASTMLTGNVIAIARQSQEPSQAKTTVHLHWGARPGVVRYRLQLANDSSFRDIVFDRVINGDETTVDDLPAGRYFWRVAPLTAKLGEFSSAGVVEITAQRQPVGPTDQVQRPVNPFGPIATSGGWRAAVGDIAQPVLAHLRAPDKFDIVGTNSDGVTYGLDASTGVALWSSRPKVVAQRTFASNAPLIVPSRARVDDVVLFVGPQVSRIEGSTGRESWRVSLPFVVTSGAAVNLSKLILVDSSLQRLMFVDSADGRLTAQMNLLGRVIGAPVALSDQNSFMLAYDTGRIEIRDSVGTLIRSGDAGSTATTAPILIRSATGNLVLVGTRDGLTAMTANDLRPLGRVAIRDQAPVGELVGQDLEGDGNIEVIMTTMRGHVVVVNAKDGRIAWDVAADAESSSLAFVDVNNDHVFDVFIAGSQGFAVALSGRDGSVIWRDSTFAAPIANHANVGAARSVLAIPFGNGALIIASEPSRAGLRAIAFSKAAIRPNSN